MRERYAVASPGAFFLDASALGALESHLLGLGWLSSNEPILSVESAGEGNMNLTLRVKTAAQTLIVKQSRPWVERYPQFDAPAHRANVEAAFYWAIAGNKDLSDQMPSLIGFDPSCSLIAMQDLGVASDCSDLYKDVVLREAEERRLVDYLSELHALTVPPSELLANREMRALNAAHLFVIPLQAENGLDLDGITEGLSDLANELKGDSAYRSAVDRMARAYVQDGSTLVHGDFYPGSWLRVNDALRVIDPEFCFLGEGAFDLGVFVAHGLLSGADPEALLARLAVRYRGEFDEGRVCAWAGVELMRRLIGYAQLPLCATLEQKRRWLALSQRWLVGS